MMDSIIKADIEKIRSASEKEFFVNRNILVTGGAGFIGSWLADVLIDMGANVTALDNMSTGRKKNINHLIPNKQFKFIESDVCTFESAEKFEVIFHMAAHASPDEYMIHPLETLRTSSSGTENIAEIARRNDATMLFASTSEVYGDAEVVPTPESYWGRVNPIGPRSCYDEGKRFAEAFLMAYHKQYDLDVRVPRIFNTYGPRLREDGFYGRALSRFISQALTNKPITVYGDGKQTRSFSYITDTVTALMILTSNSKAKGEVFNVGNTQEVTILELANKIKSTTGCKSPIEFCPLPKDDPRRRCPDTTKLERTVGWKPKVTFEEGLKRTISWFAQK